MKQSELRKIIKEELLKELDYSTKIRMNGLVNATHLSQMLKLVGNIYDDLQNEGFDEKEVVDFIITRIQQYLKV